MLSAFRNRFLLTNCVGKAFVDFYYTYSPPVADFITNHDTVSLLVWWSLLPIVGMSWMTLQLGLGVTRALLVLILALMSTIVVFFLRRLWFGYQA